jgi:hypothetical protein
MKNSCLKNPTSSHSMVGLDGPSSRGAFMRVVSCSSIGRSSVSASFASSILGAVSSSRFTSVGLVTLFPRQPFFV